VLENAARVEVLARRPEQAQQTVTSIRSQLRNAKLSWDTLDMHTLHRSAARADIIINATPQGMVGVDDQWEDLSFLQSLPAHAAVCDVIHAPRKTAFLTEAERLGLRIQNGVNMFIYQALVSTHLFLDRDIDYPAMAKVLKEAMGEEVKAASAVD
jgi:shikimate dehydrogenase